MHKRPLRAIIIDDEKPARDTLSSLINEFCSGISIIGAADSAPAARDILKEHEVDVLFLDIAMPGENGFEFLQSIDSSKYLFIFVTAYDQYALRALKASAVDYILKPVDIDELNAGIERLHQRYSTIQGLQISDENFTIQSLIHNTNDQYKGVQRLCLPDLNGFKVISADEIIFLEADSNYTIFHLADRKRIVVSRSMKEYEEVLDPNSFCRIHKSNIINLKYLKAFVREDTYRAILIDEISITISRRRLPDFLKAVKTYNLINV